MRSRASRSVHGDILCIDTADKVRGARYRRGNEDAGPGSCVEMTFGSEDYTVMLVK